MSVISYLVNTFMLVTFSCSNRTENAVLKYVVQTLPRLVFYIQNDVSFHGTRVNVIFLCPKEKQSIPCADFQETCKR